MYVERMSALVGVVPKSSLPLGVSSPPNSGTLPSGTSPLVSSGVSGVVPSDINEPTNSAIRVFALGMRTYSISSRNVWAWIYRSPARYLTAITGFNGRTGLPVTGSISKIFGSSYLYVEN